MILGEELLHLNEQLSEYLRNSQTDRQWSVESGDFVAVEENGCWMRGQIIDEIQDRRSLPVFLIDFGDTLKRAETDLRPLPAAFAKFPAFALPLRLGGIRPPFGRERYPMEAGRYLRQLAPPQQHFRFKYKSVVTDDTSPLSVDFFSVDSDSTSQLFRNELIGQGLAERLDSGNAWDPMALDFKMPTNIGPRMHQDQEFVNIGKKRVCRFYRFNGNCSRADNCTFIHLQTGSGKALSLKSFPPRRTVSKSLG